MASVQMMFDLVLINTLPTNYMAVVKVDSVLDCAHECIRQSTCEAMAFSILHTACYLYQGSIQADPTATSNMDFLIYNFKRGPECNGVFAGIPKPPYIQGDRSGSGQWVYWEETTAVVMTNTYWAANEPNGASFDQDCVSISPNGQHDARCDYTNYFFCEKYM